jgi:hypothetical protein
VIVIVIVMVIVIVIVIWSSHDKIRYVGAVCSLQFVVFMFLACYTLIFRLRPNSGSGNAALFVHLLLLLAISSADDITITMLCTQQLDAEWPLQTQTQQTKSATLQQVAISLMHLICVSPEVPTLRTLCCLLCCLFVCCLRCFGLFTLCCLFRLLLCFVCLLALCCLLCFACLRCLLAVKIPLFYFPRKIVLTSTAQLAIAYHDSEPKATIKPSRDL